MKSKNRVPANDPLGWVFESVIMHFDDLKLADVVRRAVHAEGYEIPTPIQQKAIPHVLAGQDLLGCAQTGTGKTAAFALPILSRLSVAPPSAPGSIRPIRVLVLTPTRELAVQIAESFTTYGQFTDLRSGLIFGGVSQSGQERMLRTGVDIVVATPGRLLDLMNRRLVNLSMVEVFVLDEADRMLDMGFIADIRKVIARLPPRRQNLMFSATMPPEIKHLAEGILRQPVFVAVTPVASTAERVEQTVYFLEKRAKPSLLLHLLDTDRSINRVLIFTRTKHGADRLTRGLNKHGIQAEAIHGNKSQNQRQRALDTFKQGQNRVLVATDIAARGLDIELVSHVINYELPNIPESYVHRIGRTARAGESGIAISFCDAEEREFLRDIERLIGRKIPVSISPVAASAEDKFSGQERDSDRRASSGGGRGRPGTQPVRHAPHAPRGPARSESRSGADTQRYGAPARPGTRPMVAEESNRRPTSAPASAPATHRESTTPPRPPARRPADSRNYRAPGPAAAPQRPSGGDYRNSSDTRSRGFASSGGRRDDSAGYSRGGGGRGPSTVPSRSEHSPVASRPADPRDSSRHSGRGNQGPSRSPRPTSAPSNRGESRRRWP